MFHRKTCEFLKELGIHRLDVQPPIIPGDKSTIQDKRQLFWHVLGTDYMFRLSFAKPRMLSGSSEHVKPPDVVDLTMGNPKASTTIVRIVWSRFMLITSSCFQFLDSKTAESGPSTEEVDAKIEDSLTEMENLLNDWNVVRLHPAPIWLNIEVNIS